LAIDEVATANFSVVLSAAKDLIAAWYECTLELLAMRSFAPLRMTGEGRQRSIKSHHLRSRAQRGVSIRVK